MFRFDVLAQSGQARRGRLQTPHGSVETPVFMPVGTAGSVKSLTHRDLDDLGAEMILGNTYHLFLRPGHELIEELGGLHRFVGWRRPMLTDSGGFQVFSLARHRKISEEGVTFRSHLDGSKVFLSPERSIEVQMALGADVIMAFDECPPALSERRYHEESMARTTRWAQRSKQAWRKESGSSLFGIVQGGLYPDLRKRHVEEICALDLPGYALGGYAVGEEPAQMYEGVSLTAPLLPLDKPRYLMGVGTLEDLVRSVEAGVDMFDCVYPTRCARNALLFTRQKRLNLRNARFARDSAPVDENCGCYTCQNFSRAYLRHLYSAKEMSACTLGSIHNLWTWISLMKDMRQAIEEDRFNAFVHDFFANREN